MALKEESSLFGPNGIRGPVNKSITPDLMLRVGQAAGILCRENGHQVIVGKDTRRPNYALENILTGGLLSVGTDVLLTGPVPTPGIAFLTRSMRCGLGIMITASQHEFRQGGVKLFGPNGSKLSSDKEREIDSLVTSDLSGYLVAPEDMGRSKRINGPQERCIEYAKREVPGLNLKGIRVIVDCANGAAYQVAPEALRELDAEVFAINVGPDGFNINRNCGFNNARILQDEVRAYRADFGFALDGDGDQVVIVDEKCGFYKNDVLNRTFPKWQGDGLAIALQVLNRMKPCNKPDRRASEVCRVLKRFQ